MENEMKNANEFFERSMPIIKKSIRNIKNSYNNYWDPLSELLQNSVDAIIRRNTGRGNIKIVVNSKKKSIKVKDDGVGINPMQLDLLLNPFSTDKENIANEGGENGVGVSFVIFQCNDFSIKSRFIGQKYTKTAKISNASTWCSNDENEDFCCNEIMKRENYEGTEVTIQKNDNEKIFDLSFEQLIFLIRTKTAVGNVNQIFNKDKVKINVELTFIGKSGKQFIKQIPYNYMLPTEGSKKMLTYENAIDFIEDENNTEAEKKDYLRSKIVYSTGVYREGGVDYGYWACYMPDRDEWKKINTSFNLINEYEENTTVLFKSMITLSTKGMPTAIELPIPSGLGNDGYFPNFFIILNDDSYVPDIGRKAISEEKKKIYRSITKREFSHFSQKIAPYLKQEDEEEFNVNVIEEEIKKLPIINSKIVKYKCTPHNQEAGVAAIFYELVGSKKAFVNFTPCYSAYRNKYDLYGYYKNVLYSIEFKYHLKNIIGDLKAYKKMASEMNYIVCWNVSEEDEEKINNSLKMKIQKININDYSNRKKYMPETTHLISYCDYAKPIYVVDLKEILTCLERNEKVYMNAAKKED